MAGSSNNLTALLLNAENSARLLGIGRTLFYKMNNNGQLGPVAINLGRRTLWYRRELEEWVAARCPAREQWLQKEGRQLSHENL